MAFGGRTNNSTHITLTIEKNTHQTMVLSVGLQVIFVSGCTFELYGSLGSEKVNKKNPTLAAS